MATAGPSPTKAAVKPVAKPAASAAKTATKPAVRTGTATKATAAKASAKAAPTPAPAPVSITAKEVDPQMAAAAVGGLIVLLLGGYFAFGRPKTPYRVAPPRNPGGIQPPPGVGNPGGSQQPVFGSGSPGATKPGAVAVNTGPTPPPPIGSKPVPATGIGTLGAKTGAGGVQSPASGFGAQQPQPVSPFGPNQGTQPAQQIQPATVGVVPGQPMQQRQTFAPMSATPPGQGQPPAAGQPAPLEGGTSASLIGETKGKAATHGDGQEVIIIGSGSKVVPLEAPAPPPKN